MIEKYQSSLFIIKFNELIEYKDESAPYIFPGKN